MIQSKKHIESQGTFYLRVVMGMDCIYGLVYIYIYTYKEREGEIFSIKNIKYIELQRICFFFRMRAVMMTGKTGIIGVGSHPGQATGQRQYR